MTQQKRIQIPLKNGDSIHLTHTHHGYYDLTFTDGRLWKPDVPLFGMGQALHHPRLDWFNAYLDHITLKANDLQDLLEQLQTHQSPGAMLSLNNPSKLLEPFNYDLATFERYLLSLGLGFVQAAEVHVGFKFHYFYLSGYQTLGDAFSSEFLEQAFAFATEHLTQPGENAPTYDVSQLNPDWNLSALLFALRTEETLEHLTPNSIKYQRGPSPAILVSMAPLFEGLATMPDWARRYLYDLLLGYPIPLALGETYSVLYE